MTYSSFSRRYFCSSLVIASALLLSACGTTGTTAQSRPMGTVDSAIEKALKQAESQGDVRQSLILLEQIHTRNPDNVVVATRFARALREDEQLNKARLVLTPFVKSENSDPEALTEMSMIHISLGQYKEAEQFAREAITADSRDGRSYLALGTALDAQNYHEQAEVAFRRGLENWKGDTAPILNNLALNLASQGHLDEALNVLEKAREIAPQRIEIERNYRIISTLRETSGPPRGSEGGAPKEAPLPERKPGKA